MSGPGAKRTNMGDTTSAGVGLLEDATSPSDAAKDYVPTRLREPAGPPRPPGTPLPSVARAKARIATLNIKQDCGHRINFMNCTLSLYPLWFDTMYMFHSCIIYA